MNEKTLNDKNATAYIIAIKTSTEEVPQKDIEELLNKYSLVSKSFLNASIPYKTAFIRGLGMYLKNITLQNTDEQDELANEIKFVKKKVDSDKETETYEIVKETIVKGIGCIKFDSEFGIKLNKTDDDFDIAHQDQDTIYSEIQACINECGMYFKGSDVKKMVKEFMKNANINFYDSKLNLYWLEKSEIDKIENIYKFCESVCNVSLVLIPVEVNENV